MKPSHFALLVVVAGGTLGTHQYLIAHPEIELPFPVPFAPRTADMTPEQLGAVLVKKADQVVKLSRQNPQDVDTDQAARLLKKIDELDAQLGSGEDAPPRNEVERQLVVLHAKYAATLIDRLRFSAEFLDYANRLLPQAEGFEKDQIDLLVFLSSHDFNQAQGRELCQKLDQFAAEHAADVCAQLYCMTAEKLVLAKHAEVAKSVLHHGLEYYDSTPFAGRIVNHLAELGLAKPPATRISLEARD